MNLEQEIHFDEFVLSSKSKYKIFFFFQAEDGIRDHCVTGVQTCALPICFEGSQRLEACRVASGTRAVGGANVDDRHGLDVLRSEERRVGKECRSRWSPYH